MVKIINKLVLTTANSVEVLSSKSLELGEAMSTIEEKEEGIWV